jgi:hypothetical protein
MVRSGMGAFMFPSNLAPLQRREVSASWERGDEDFREIESSGMKVFFQSLRLHLVNTRCRIQQSFGRSKQKFTIHFPPLGKKTYHIPFCECAGLI